VIFTIGHSNRTADAFLALLAIHDVRQIADVRTFPRSRRHPHFDGEAIAVLLERHGRRYRHFPELGGRRRPARGSTNSAWQHPAFRGYADHMQTAAFQAGVDRLLTFALGGPTAVMCAEAVWWQCHRRLLADALLVRGVEVRHILSDAAPKPHELNEFARVDGQRVSYPGLLPD
jgi:uncharacterized protein (DUF488 family)